MTKQETREAKQQAGQDKRTDAYAALMIEINEKLETISNALTDQVNPDEVTWGHIGSLEYANARLAEIAAFLTGAEA